MSDFAAAAPVVGLLVSVAGIVGTLVYCGRTIGRLEQRLEAAERALNEHTAAKGHTGSLELVADLRERTAVLEQQLTQDRAHTRETLEGLRVAVNEMRKDLRDALSEVRADMRKIMGGGG